MLNEPGISIRVVCNDAGMSNEIVEKLYEFGELVEYDVIIESNRLYPNSAKSSKRLLIYFIISVM